MHLGSLLVIHGLERGVAAVGRGLAGGDVECLGPKLSQLERFDGGCADYDPDAVGAALRRRRAGAAVLYRGDACRTKGWVKHDFAGQIAANHRAELWEPLRRAFGFVELYGHVSGPPACVAAMRGTANWTRLEAIETSTEHYSSKKWFNAGHDWFRNVTNGAAGFVVVARPDIVFRRPVDAFLDAGRLNLFHFEDVRFGRACGAQARACFETGCHWMNSDALFAAPGLLPALGSEPEHGARPRGLRAGLLRRRARAGGEVRHRAGDGGVPQHAGLRLAALLLHLRHALLRGRAPARRDRGRDVPEPHAHRDDGLLLPRQRDERHGKKVTSLRRGLRAAS